MIVCTEGKNDRRLCNHGLIEVCWSDLLLYFQASGDNDRIEL